MQRLAACRNYGKPLLKVSDGNCPGQGGPRDSQFLGFKAGLGLGVAGAAAGIGLGSAVASSVTGKILKSCVSPFI